jgi:hypothetical protein
VAANAYRSVTTCRKAPVRFRLRASPCAARAMSSVATTLTATPASATPSTVPPVTAGGVTRRRIAEYSSQAASRTRVMPLAWADMISVRLSP